MKLLKHKSTCLGFIIGLLVVVFLMSCENDDEGAYGMRHDLEQQKEWPQSIGNQIAMNIM